MATQIQSAEERMLIRAYNEYYSKCAAIMKCEPLIDVTISKVPLQNIAYMCGVNKLLELDTIKSDKCDWHMTKIKTLTGSIEIEDYDKDQHIPF